VRFPLLPPFPPPMNEEKPISFFLLINNQNLLKTQRSIQTVFKKEESKRSRPWKTERGEKRRRKKTGLIQLHKEHQESPWRRPQRKEKRNTNHAEN
jgi:hypothetical protein